MKIDKESVYTKKIGINRKKRKRKNKEIDPTKTFIDNLKKKER